VDDDVTRRGIDRGGGEERDNGDDGDNEDG